MPHSKISLEIVAFANEAGYFPTDEQVGEIRRIFARAVAEFRRAQPVITLGIGKPDYDRMLWDSIEKPATSRPAGLTPDVT